MSEWTVQYPLTQGNEKRFSFSERGNNQTLETNLTNPCTQDRQQNVWVKSVHGGISLSRFEMTAILKI